jgi:hypothetical protein
MPNGRRKRTDAERADRVCLIDITFVWHKLREFLPQIDELVIEEAAKDA